MAIYQLRVHYLDEDVAREVVDLATALDVLERIAELVLRHPGCAEVLVCAGRRELFKVNCVGGATTSLL